MTFMKNTLRYLSFAACGVLLLASCGSDPSEGPEETTSDTPDATSEDSQNADESPTSEEADAAEAVLHVRASFYPLEFVLTEIGGDRIEVIAMTPPGVDPHNLELSPHDIAQIETADLAVYLSGFQPAVDEAVSLTGIPALDVAEAARLIESGHDHDEDEDDHDEDEDDGHGHGSLDPHFWLDPLRLADVAEVLAEELTALDPDGSEVYATGLEQLTASLQELDEQYTDGLAVCELDTIVVAHEAYGYLETRYHLHQEGVSGIDPETEPSPARLAEIGRIVNEAGVETIFVETLLNPTVVETLATDLGVSTALLDPLENQQEPTHDYLDVMAANLDALREAMRCS